MAATFLNITNGDSLTDKLKQQHYEGDFLVWSEMLCEGPTTEVVGSALYFEKRKAFFSNFYDLIFEENKFYKEVKKLDDIDNYTHIVLWFEYDLFCQINMLAVISLLRQKNIDLPIYLVSSGFTKKDHTLKGLSELSDKQLKKHYKNKVLLSLNDLDLAISVWQIYCGSDHNILRPYITQNSSFKYLGSCLKAHLKRFPDSTTGMSVLENNLLNIIVKNKVSSKHHLLGYMLNYQGYYGYGDLQLIRIIDNMQPFYSENEDGLTLNKLGEQALEGKTNFSAIINDRTPYGGVHRLDYQFSIDKNKLIKPQFNANTIL